MQATETLQVDFTPLMEYLSEKFQKIDQRFESIDRRFDQIDKRFEVLEMRMDGMPTKSYANNIMAELEGRYTTMYLRSEYKSTRLAEILASKGVIAAHDLKELNEFPIKTS